jgi:hypothetical protein
MQDPRRLRMMILSMTRINKSGGFSVEAFTHYFTLSDDNRDRARKIRA